jgi:hypothetical protein
VGGSNPDFWRNQNFAEFFAVYHENCVFWPHLAVFYYLVSHICCNYTYLHNISADTKCIKISPWTKLSPKHS